jgi:hypothetical protein
MRGLPNFNFPAFHAAAADLRDRGYEVWSPAEHDQDAGFVPTTGEGLRSLREYMRDDLPALLGSDKVVVLPGWEASEGARLEVHVAETCGIPVLVYPDLAPIDTDALFVELLARTKGGDSWLLTQTAHETALAATDGFPSNRFGSRTSEPANGTIDARSVTGNTSAVGSSPTESEDVQPFSVMGDEPAFALSDMGSLASSTTKCSRTRETFAPSVANSIGPRVEPSTPNDYSTSITMRKPGVFAVFSVLSATRQSGSCDTMQFSVCAPPGTFAHRSAQNFYSNLFELALLSAAKQADYGRADDPFANVRGSIEWGVPAWVGALIRATDKVRRLQTQALRGSLANESAVDAFDDLAVYAVIGRVLFEEQECKGKAA